MVVLAQESTAALRHLAVAVDADRGAHLFFDRGDGVLELAASVRDGRAVAVDAASGPAPVDPGRLRRLLPSSLGGAVGATARIATG